MKFCKGEITAQRIYLELSIHAREWTADNKKQNPSGFSPKVLFVILLVCTNNILFLFIQIMKTIFHNKSDWYEHVHFLRNRESSG